MSAQDHAARLDDLEQAGWDAPRAWLLTAQERLAARFLVNREEALKADMLDAFEGAGGRALDPDCCKVVVSKVRTKTARFGVVIGTAWGRGWKIAPEMRAAIRRGEHDTAKQERAL